MWLASSVTPVRGKNFTDLKVSLPSSYRRSAMKVYRFIDSVYLVMGVSSLGD